MFWVQGRREPVLLQSLPRPVVSQIRASSSRTLRTKAVPGNASRIMVNATGPASSAARPEPGPPRGRHLLCGCACSGRASRPDALCPLVCFACLVSFNLPFFSFAFMHHVPFDSIAHLHVTCTHTHTHTRTMFLRRAPMHFHERPRAPLHAITHSCAYCADLLEDHGVGYQLEPSGAHPSGC